MDKWRALSQEFRQFGITYQPAKLADPDWCVKELARLGYSISVTYVTRAWAFSQFGRDPDYPNGIDGMYTYQLWGPRYQNRGAHPCPLVDTIDGATAVALFNVCRLDFFDMVEDRVTTVMH
jgi:hypothetical protein